MKVYILVKTTEYGKSIESVFDSLEGAKDYYLYNELEDRRRRQRCIYEVMSFEVASKGGKPHRLIMLTEKEYEEKINV
jgi:hypothetical protein